MRRESGSRARRALRACAGALALAVALAACPGGGDGRPSPRPAPRRGGEVVVAYPYEPATLNPFVAGGDNLATRDLVRLLYPGLYRLGPKGAREPWLLASEPADRDVGGTPFSVRLRLRSDAAWSDGKPITADDVRFTWQAVMGSPAAATKDGYDRLTDVVAEDSKTVRLVFREPFARWRDLFSAGLGVLPAHALGGTDISGALAESWPVSGGPFVLSAWTKGLELVLDRNARAWGGEPLLDRIRIQFIPDAVTALQLYARGEVDVLGPYVAVEFARRAGALGAQVTGDRGGTWAGLFLNVKEPALSDERVRQGLASAIDRADILEGLVRAQGARLDAPSAGDAARTSPSFSRYAFDTGAAGRLFDAAGFTVPTGGGTRRKGRAALSLTLASVGADELVTRVVRAIHAQSSLVGVEVTLVALDADEFWRSWLPGPRFQAALVVVRDPPGGDLRARYGAAGSHGISRLGDEALAGLLDAADRTLDDKSPAVTAPFDRVAELAPVIPFALLEVTIGARPGIHEVRASAAADGFLYDAASWWREAATPSPGPTVSPS